MKLHSLVLLPQQNERIALHNTEHSTEYLLPGLPLAVLISALTLQFSTLAGIAG